MNSTASPRHLLRGIGASVSLLALGAVAACGSGSGKDAESNDAVATHSVHHDLGTTKNVPVKPKRIVSASVSLTGSLLAMHAPVSSVVATKPSKIADKHGFLKAWADKATKRHVKPIPGPEIDLEKIQAAQPDLIVAAKGGQDDGSKVYDKLSKIAPTVVYDYSKTSWKHVTKELGKATGRSKEAQRVLGTFDKRVARVKKQITLPPQPTSLYTVTPEGANVFRRASPQGELLQSLGFHLTEPKASGTTQGGGTAVTIAPEKFSDALNGRSALVILKNEKELPELRKKKTLGTTPAFKNKKVHALGYEPFRLDPYSANLVLDRVQQYYGS